MDRISNLPDELIHKIIFLLSTKEAVFLKYTSRRFLNLVTVIANANLDLSIEIRPCLVYLLSELSRDYSYRIRRFSLKLRFINFDSSLYNLVNDCLRSVLKRGVLDLELDINVQEDYRLPSELFTCRSVEKLKLGFGFVIDLIPENALLPSLKTLVLDSVRFVDLDGCAFQKLLSSSPVLNELVIDRLNWEKWNWSRVVSSLTLERFTTRREVWEGDGYVRSDSEILSIDTPSLVYLEYADVLLEDYPVVNLNSLIEAKLTFPEDDVLTFATNLIRGLKNVQILHLDSVSTVVLFYRYRVVAPMFQNLSRLSIVAGPDDCWLGLRVLLGKSPNLKTLIINGSLHYNDDDDDDDADADDHDHDDADADDDDHDDDDDDDDDYDDDDNDDDDDDYDDDDDDDDYVDDDDDDDYDDDHRWDLKIVCDCLMGYSFLLTCPIEVLKITMFKGDIGEMVQIKHFLEKLPSLKLLELDVQIRRTDKMLKMMKDLLLFPRGSSKCKVKIEIS